MKKQGSQDGNYMYCQYRLDALESNPGYDHVQLHNPKEETHLERAKYKKLYYIKELLKEGETINSLGHGNNIRNDTWITMHETKAMNEELGIFSLILRGSNKSIKD